MPRLLQRFVPILVLAALALSALPSQEEDWYVGKTIKNVEFAGVRAAERRDLEAIAKPFIGKKFSDELFLELQSLIAELDYFESAEPSAVEVPGDGSSMIIRFKVTPRPAVDAVRFEGNQAIKSFELSSVVLTKVGDLSNKLRIAQDEDAIRKYYIDKGYTQVVVSSEEKANPTGDGVVVYFTIDEGQAIAVKKISIVGNSAFSEKSLKSALPLKEIGFLQPGAFREDLLEECKTALVTYYSDRGYIDAAVTDLQTDFQPDEKKNRSLATITFTVSEGRQYVYAGVTFEGNEVFKTEKLESLFYQKPDKPMSMSKFKADLNRVRSLYMDEGYVFSPITPVEKRDEEEGKVSYTIKIVERDRAHISQIIIKGNVKTKDKVILRELPIEEGDVYSREKISDGLRNLYNLQYFSDISIDPQPVSEQIVDLIFNVEEQSTAGFNFAVKYQPVAEDSAALPLGAFVTWNDRNFLGNGQNFEITADVSAVKQSLIFSFTEKWLFDTRWLGGINLSINHEKESVAQDIAAPIFPDGVPDPYTSYEEYSASNFQVPAESLMYYDSVNLLLSPSVGYLFKRPLGLPTDLGLRLDASSMLENIFYDDEAMRPYSSDLRANHEVWLLTDAISLYSYLDALDYSFIPTSGIALTNKITLTGFFDFERQHYLRDDLKLEAFATLVNLPVLENWNFKLVLGGHSSLTSVFPVPGVDMAVKTGSYPRVDGMMTMRGWTDLAKFDCLDIWYNWAELRMELVPQLLWLDAFLDGGVARGPGGLIKPGVGGGTIEADKDSLLAMDWENWAFSAGASLRLTLPQLPIKLGIAKKFIYRDGKLQGAGGKVFTDPDDPTAGWSIVISMIQPMF